MSVPVTEPEGAPPNDAAAVEVVPRSLVPHLWRTVLGLLAGLGVTVAVVLIFNPHIAQDAANAERQAVQPIYLLAALGCVIVYLAADAWCLVILADSCCRMPAKGVVRVAIEAHFVGGASSFGGFEIPYQVALLRRMGMSGSHATSAVVIKGLIHAALLAVVALVSLLPWVDSPITSLQRWLLLILTVALAGGWTIGWAWLRRPLGRGLLPERFHARIDALREAVHSFRGTRWLYVKLILLQLIYWVAMFGVLLCVLHALGWRGAPAPIITGQAVMQVLMPLSPLPGGAGVAEFSYLALIGPSTPSSIHVSSLVLWRLFTWLVPVALGGLFLGLRGSHHRRRDAR
jgi:glycosyltransferase 2 family protein